MVICKYGAWTSRYRLGYVAGAEYNSSKDFMIELIRNIESNNLNLGVFCESLIKMLAVYTVGSKL